VVQKGIRLGSSVVRGLKYGGFFWTRANLGIRNFPHLSHSYSIGRKGGGRVGAEWVRDGGTGVGWWDGCGMGWQRRMWGGDERGMELRQKTGRVQDAG
jgi:hypothetical protein